MAVSKIAVIALVAVIAVPILLGYAFNLEEVTDTDYKTTGSSVNVTPLLQNGVEYNYSHGNSYQLNSRFGVSGAPSILPVYESYTTAKTSMKGTPINNVGSWYPASTYNLADYAVFYDEFNYDKNACHIDATITKSDSTTVVCSYVYTFYYDPIAKSVKWTSCYGNNLTYGVVTDAVTAIFTVYGTWYSTTYGVYSTTSGNSYVDIAAGYHFTGLIKSWSIKLPNYTNSVIITMDLNSITDSTYSIVIGAAASSYTLEKSTTGGVISWLIRDNSNPSRTIDLYYDQSRSSNTYQIYWDLTEKSNDSTYTYYNSHREFRYVGDWPNVIGEANVYLNFTDDVGTRAPIGSPIYIDTFDMYNSSNDRSPIVRADDAYFRAFEYQVIKDQTYIPSNFRSNPITTISDIQIFGSSITFAGSTYTVTDGKITLNGHKIPVDNLSFSSVPGENGGYDNRIGNTLISNTIQPSTITFDGSWSASVSTQSLQSQTTTKTEWKAGEFAWDGIDHNFIMAGLLASLGAFVGVGIYAQRTKATVWPLLIVCGGAALLFFVML